MAAVVVVADFQTVNLAALVELAVVELEARELLKTLSLEPQTLVAVAVAVEQVLQAQTGLRLTVVLELLFLAMTKI
jgi:hypothetical protein